MCFKALVQGQELVQIRLDHQQIHFATHIGQAALLDPGGQGASLLTDEDCMRDALTNWSRGKRAQPP